MSTSFSHRQQQCRQSLPTLLLQLTTAATSVLDHRSSPLTTTLSVAVNIVAADRSSLLMTMPSVAANIVAAAQERSSLLTTTPSINVVAAVYEHRISLLTTPAKSRPCSSQALPLPLQLSCFINGVLPLHQRCPCPSLH